jgi:cell wall-associated NlpC family hydrolase
MKKRFMLMFGFLLLAGLFMTTKAYAQETTDLKVGKVTGSIVNVRTTPSTGGQWVTTLSESCEVLIHGQENSWYKVSYQGNIGYMYAEYLEPRANGEGKYGYAVVTGSFVRIRSIPSTEGIILGTLSEGLNVKVLGVKDGWYKVQYGNVVGFMNPEYLEPIKMIEQPKTSNNTGSKTGSSGSSTTKPSGPSSTAQKIVSTAKQYIGIRYVYGGSSPSTGFDCSGLVTYVFKQYGITFKQRTRLYLDGANVSYNNLMPGDLVFFDSNRNGTIGHVGIYVGNGSFIHAPRPGAKVRIESMTSGFYRNTFVCARRVV